MGLLVAVICVVWLGVSAHAARAAYPAGANGMIAWVTNGFQSEVGPGEVSYSVVASNPDGSNVTPITINDVDSPEQDIGAVWSPDGNKLALSTCSSGLFGCNASTGIDLIDWDGSDRTPLVSEGTSPTWSPDGDELMYRGDQDDSGQWRSLYRIKSDGTGKTQVPLDDSCAIPRLRGGLRWANTPTGEKVIFDGVCWNAATGDRRGVYMMDPDASNLALLYGADFALGVQGLDVSPDATKVVFSGYTGNNSRGYNKWDLFEYTIATGALRNLTNTSNDVDGNPEYPNNETAPAYSPDGASLGYAGPPTPSHIYADIWVLDDAVAGTGARKLVTRDDVDDLGPDWQPCVAGTTLSCAPPPACSDNQDDDRDGKIDWPDDPGCSTPTDDDETDPASSACSDGIDNDGDGRADFPDDPGCVSASDDDETDPSGGAGSATATSCPGLPGGVRGFRPGWRFGATLARFANDDAACEAIWVPYIDDRFVPQGLALRGDGSAFVSGYDDTSERCRIVLLDLASGAPVGQRELKEVGSRRCKHGGGIAIDPSGRIWLADTQTLFILDSLGDPSPQARRLRDKPDADMHGMKASFLVEGAGRLLVGDYDRQRLLSFSYGQLLSTSAIANIGPEDALDSRDVPQKPQGGDFRAGKLWFTSSTGSCGQLHRPGADLSFGPGAEEIEFSPDGSLWAVFEAGSKKKKFEGPGRPFFPLIVRFKTAALTKEDPGKCDPPTTFGPLEATSKGARWRLACPAPSSAKPCKAELVLLAVGSASASRRGVLGRKKASIRAGTSRRLTVKLSRAGRRALKRKGHMRVRVNAVIRYRSNSKPRRKVARRTVVLKRKRGA